MNVLQWQSHHNANLPPRPQLELIMRAFHFSQSDYEKPYLIEGHTKSAAKDIYEWAVRPIYRIDKGNEL